MIYRYKTSHFVRQQVSQNNRFVFLATTTILVLCVYYSPIIQTSLEPHFATDQKIEGLRSIILNIGSALIGATAIVTSLVLFAMQVNIERMPYGLFHRLSKDKYLLISFAISFMLAIYITTLSIFADKDHLSYIILSSFWSVIFILSLYLYAYRRALKIINPVEQLRILRSDTCKELQAWTRSADHASYIMETQESEITNEFPTSHTHDILRLKYFLANKGWTNGSRMSVRYAMSFAQRYAQQGDHQVSSVALSTIIDINAVYITAKGKTFFTLNFFLDNPLATDGFINDTLACFRQNMQNGISRRDELLIEQYFKTLTALVNLYASIDYSNQHASKFHAMLASRYLSDAVQLVAPYGMIDVLMEGLRQLGKSAQYILFSGKPDDIAQLIEKITQITSIWSVKENYLPVAVEGMTQLADMTIKLLHYINSNIQFSAKNIRSNVTMLVKLFLRNPRTASSISLSEILGPYYSSTTTYNLRALLRTLVNEIYKTQDKHIDANAISRNIEKWADGLYKTEKELLLTAIDAKSYFAFDITRWITGISEILIVASNAPACDLQTQEKLRSHAFLLISIFDSIPDDCNKIAFIDNVNLKEILFAAAVNAHDRGCDDIAKATGNILLSWAFKSGKYKLVRNNLVKSLCALAVLALKVGDEGILWLKTIISSMLSSTSTFEQITLNNAASYLLARANNLDCHEYSTSEIDAAITYSDQTKLAPLLHEIAHLLSPGIVSKICKIYQPTI